MRRSILGLTLVVGVLFMLGAAPGTASAANCQFGFTPVVYANQVWTWDGTAQNCTGVNAVEFRDASTATAYIVQTNNGSVHFSYAGGGVAYSPYYPGVGAGQYYAHYYNGIWGPGCGGGAFFWESKHYAVRIHNVNNGGSWGGWSNATSSQEPIC